jgi:hypothetical protein
MSTYVLRKGIAELNDLKDGYAAVFASANKIFHVDAAHASASDSNLGTDRNKPLSTITQAYNNCTTDVGDVILIHGADYRYRESDTLTILKDGISIIGSGWGTEWNNNGSLAGGYVVKVEAKAVRIANIQISINDSGAGIYVGDGNANKNASMCMIEDCFIRGDWLTETGPGAGIGIGIENDGASLMTVRNCHIWGWGTGIDVSDGAYRTAYGAHIYNNKIMACQNYGIRWTGIGYVSVIDNNTICDFSPSVTMTYAITLSPTTGGVTVSGNKIAAAAPVYDSGDLNYWVGNFIRSTEAASETQAVGMCAIDATVDTD